MAAITPAPLGKDWNAVSPNTTLASAEHSQHNGSRRSLFSPNTLPKDYRCDRDGAPDQRLVASKERSIDKRKLETGVDVAATSRASSFETRFALLRMRIERAGVRPFG
jgi:hypothetical protein